ncbi:MAG: DNA-binding protein [Pedobacter sp.]|nr:MAG: DNA-binding protein [Pedobacter sp.]
MENPFELISQQLIEIQQRLERIENALKIVDDANVKYLKVDDAAAFLSMTPGAIRVMTSSQKIPHFKKLGKLYFKLSDLIKWIETSE